MTDALSPEVMKLAREMREGLVMGPRAIGEAIVSACSVADETLAIDDEILVLSAPDNVVRIDLIKLAAALGVHRLSSKRTFLVGEIPNEHPPSIGYLRNEDIARDVLAIADEWAARAYTDLTHMSTAGIIARALTADRASCQARVEELEALLENAIQLGGTLGAYFIRFPTQVPDHEFVNVCNGDLRRIYEWVEGMGRNPLQERADAATLRALADRKEGDA